MAKKKVKLTSPPATIKVGYTQYTVTEGDSSWSDKNDSDFGGFDSKEEKITYSKDHPSQLELVNTIIHENLHAVGDYFGMVFENEEMEEHYVKAFANGLTSLFVDNPEFLDWVYSSIKEQQ